MKNDIQLIKLLVEVLTLEARGKTFFTKEIDTLERVAEVINENKMIDKIVSAASIRQAKYRLKRQGILEHFAPDFDIFLKSESFLLSSEGEHA